MFSLKVCTVSRSSQSLGHRILAIKHQDAGKPHYYQDTTLKSAMITHVGAYYYLAHACTCIYFNGGHTIKQWLQYIRRIKYKTARQ